MKVAIFKGKIIIRRTILECLNLKSIKNFIDGVDLESSIISSVKELDDDVLEIVNYYNAIILKENIKIPIINKYKTLETLGNDRLAAIVGAIFLFPDQDVLVFDSGTCLTIDFINSKQQYLGGRISPGIDMRFKSLYNFTDKLPLLNQQKKVKYIGDDTESSIISGVQQGILSEVKDVISGYKSCNSNTMIVFTGGDSIFFEKELKNSIFAEPNLVLIGLNEILDYNE